MTRNLNAANLSRRQCLCAIALLAPAITAVGQQPTAPTRTTELRTTGTTSLPVQSRVYRLEGATNAPVVVTAIAADPRGQYLAVSGDDHVIRILSAANYRVVHKLTGHRDLIRSLAFDPAGEKLVSAGNDGQLMLWDRGDAFAQLQVMSGTPAIARVRFAPDGREMAAVGFDNEIYLIGRTVRPRSVLQCDCNDLRAVAYREDGAVIAVAGRSGDLHLFHPERGELSSEHPLHKGRIHDVVFHRQSNIAVSVGEDGDVTVFDTRERKLRHRVNVTTGKLFAVAVLNSHSVAVAGSDNVIRVVNTDVGEVTQTLEGHRGSIAALAASDDGLVSGGFDAMLRRWSIADIVTYGARIADADGSVGR
ncbi:WD40 repeat domain-containing protein [Rubripirellula tenax]|nr:WD40 repeat domain-containing protein [Rubripirellula tenax]